MTAIQFESKQFKCFLGQAVEDLVTARGVV